MDVCESQELGESNVQVMSEFVSKQARIYRFIKKDLEEEEQEDLLRVDALQTVKEQYIKPMQFMNKRANRLFSSEEICCHLGVGYFTNFGSSALTLPFEELGPSIVLYFRLLKHLIGFMLLALLVQIFSMYIFYQNLNLLAETGFKGDLFLLSLGTLGLKYNKCSFDVFSATNYEQFKFSCSTGTLVVDDMYYVSTKSSLSCINSNIDQSSEKAGLVAGILDEIKSACNAKQSCSFRLYPNNYTSQEKERLYRNNGYAHFARAFCRKQTFQIWNNVSIRGEAVGLLIVAVDCLVMLGYLYMLFSLKYSFRETILNFNKESVGLERFSLQTQVAFAPEEQPHIILSEFMKQLQRRANNYLAQNQSLKIVAEGMQLKEVRVLYLTYATRINKSTFTSKVNELIKQLGRKLTDHREAALKRGEQERDIQSAGVQMLEGPQCKKEWKGLEQLIAQKQKNNSIDYVFLTFNNAFERDLMLKAFEKTKWLEKCREHDPDLYFKGERVRLEPGSYPQQIEWQNLYYSNAAITFKSIISFLVALLVFAGAYIFLAFLGEQQRVLLKGSYLGGDCSAIRESFTQQTPWNPEWANFQYYPGYQNCYCLAKLTTVYSLSECKTWLASYIEYNSLPIAFSLVVLVFNIMLQWVLTLMTEWQGHKSSGRKLSSQVLKLYVLQFLTSGLVILLINMKTTENSVQNQSQFLKMLFGGSYSTFNSSWYLQIGYTVILTMLFNIANPILRLAIDRTLICLRRCWDQSGDCFSKPTRLASITLFIQLYSGPEYLLAEQCSFVLALVTICLFYGQVMPVLYLISLVCLSLLYWIDKYLLCMVYKKPPNYDKALMSTIRMALILPFLAHCLAGIFFMSSGAIFPQAYTLQSLNQVESSFGLGSFWQFIYIVQVYPYAAIILAMLIFKLFQTSFSGLLKCLSDDIKEYSQPETNFIQKLNWVQSHQLEDKVKADFLSMIHKEIPLSGGKSVRLKGNFDRIAIASSTHESVSSDEIRPHFCYVSHLIELEERLRHLNKLKRNQVASHIIGQSFYDKKLTVKQQRRTEKLLLFQKMITNL